jgi:hypothetical protein
MKRSVTKTVCLLLFCILVFSPAFAQGMTNDELMQELRAMNARIIELEAEVQALKVPLRASKEKHMVKATGENNLADRVRQIEERIGEAPVLGSWTENIKISGLVEVEAGYEDMTLASSVTDEDLSDITLATVELGVDVDIAKHVKGHVLLLWEEDDTEPLDVDEAFITLDGQDVIPFYLSVGKMYVPFGNFESHFISDPLTLELGETRESAMNIGYVNDRVEISAAIFNGDIDEADDDDHINGFVGTARLMMPENSLPGVDLTVGVSYISNIADSDGLEGEMANSSVDDSVAGFGAFLNASLMDRFFFEAEYVGALDEFEAGELSFDGGQEFQPKTWNFEFAVAATENLKAAIKCEGGEDLADFLPELQYGVAVAYDLFKNMTLSLEYLYGEFENDDERDLLTTQLAIEF